MDEGKVCVTCHVWRPREAFNRRAAAKDGLQARCRPCSQAWYQANKAEHTARTARRKRETREEYHRRLCAYVEDHPCVDCGERDVVVLEFDHRDAGTKVREVAKMVNLLAPWGAVLTEIAKCEVCCANCHRRRTAARGDQRRHRHEQARQAELTAVARDRLRRLLPAP